MAKLKPLGSMANGKITLNKEKMKSVFKKKNCKQLANWIDDQLADYSETHKEGYYQIFIRLYSDKTKLFLEIDTDKYRDQKGNICIPDLLSLLGKQRI